MHVDPVWLALQLALRVPPRLQQTESFAAGLAVIGLGPFVLSPTHGSCTPYRSRNGAHTTSAAVNDVQQKNGPPPPAVAPMISSVLLQHGLELAPAQGLTIPSEQERGPRRRSRFGQEGPSEQPRFLNDFVLDRLGIQGRCARGDGAVLLATAPPAPDPSTRPGSSRHRRESAPSGSDRRSRAGVGPARCC